MQSKGVIRVFAIVFALACLYQLSFTYVSKSVESDAEAYADGDFAKRQAYLDSINSEPVYDIFVDEFTYAEVKEKEINLGLDLRGGMNVILEVSVKDILRELTDNSQHPVFKEALERADMLAKNNQEAYLENFFQSFEAIGQEKGLSLNYSDAKVFGTKEMNEKLGFNASDSKVKSELRAQIDASVANVYTVLRARIDQFGVIQPNIQRLDQSGRILVELPGVKDPDRVKRLLQSTAELEFWELYEGVELLDFLNAANEKLKSIVEPPEDFRQDTTLEGGDAEEALDDLDITPVGEETASLSDTATEVDTSKGAGDSTVDSLLAGTGDSTDLPAQAFNPLYELLTPNYNFQDNTPREGPVVGYAKVQDTGKVNDYLQMPRIRRLLNGQMRNLKFIWSAKPDENDIVVLLAAKAGRDQKAPLSGDVVVDASQDFDQGNNPIVSMSMNARGARIWKEMTKKASEQNPKRSVAVVLDGFAYSFPRVQGEIPTGNTQISGNFTVQEATDLANILKAGALPAPTNIIQANIVGPSLGQEAIQSGLWSFVVALILVLIYMIFYYNGAGLASNVALITNMFFVFGVLASLGAVLTLPGIAGIVLTIGMAVDANVLIYERIREELRHGKGLRLAISDGYKNAYSSIIDANVTTFLTGVILYSFGTGPIRGFATTLIIGILTSLFSAIFITRLVFEARLVRKKAVSFSSKITKDAFTKVNFDFLKKSKLAYFISGTIITLGIISLVVRGLNYGVDFVGGRSYQVRFDQPVSSVELQKTLGEFFKDESGSTMPPEVKTVGNESQVIITTKYKVNETGPAVEDEIKRSLYEGLQDFYQQAPTMAAFSSETTGDENLGIVAERQVGPTIADDIKTSALWSVVFSLLVIFLYILIRFSKWQFSAGAVLAAFHDVMIVLSIFSLLYGFLPFSMEIDQAFIAAILTVIGYSLNDTVVVFDRIREFLTISGKRKPINEVVNQALNSTLSRTVNTSLTTFFVLLIIFIFGGEVIRGFMFALLIGIIVGTYSSLMIATPFTIDTMKKQIKKEED